MKKTRFIALVLAISLMIMGSGYAYWSDTLVVTNTIDTGKLDVNFEKSKRTPAVVSVASKYMEAKIDVNKDNTKNAIIEISEIYPGGNAKFKVTVKNDGTLPAKFTGAELKYVTGNESLYNILKGNYSYNFDKYTKPFSSAEDLVEVDAFGGPGHGGDSSVVIEPGYSRDFYITVEMPGKVENLQDVKVTMKLELDWEQGVGKSR